MNSRQRRVERRRLLRMAKTAIEIRVGLEYWTADGWRPCSHESLGMLPWVLSQPDERQPPMFWVRSKV